jgi:AmpE protein
MKLIIILICLAGLRYIHLGRTVKRYNWFTSYAVAMQKYLQAIKQPWIITLLILLPLLIITLLIQLGLTHGIFYVIEFLFAVIAVWYCLWPISLSEQLETSIGKQKAANDQSASEMNDDEAVDPEEGDTRALTEAMLCHANNRTFAVIFWFAVLGPFGAVLYCCIAQLTKISSRPGEGLNAIARVAHTLEDLLDWLPARLAALGYVIAGDFSNGFKQWIHHFNGGLSSNQDLLISTGFGAMNINPEATGDEEEARQVLRLIDRSLIVWLVVIAIFTLGALIY